MTAETLSQKFQATTAPADALIEMIRDAATYYHASFEKLNKLVVTDDTGIIYASAAAEKLIAAHPEKAQFFIVQAQLKMTLNNCGAAAAKMSLQRQDVVHLHVNADFFRSKAPMVVAYMVGHEIGHWATELGLQKKDAHVGECAADAFALLRHIQQFPETTPAILDRFITRVACVGISLEDRPIHYTSAALQKIADLHWSGNVDIKNMSPADTAHMADEIAERYFIDSAIQNKIATAFAPVREYMGAAQKNYSVVEFFKVVTDVMQQNRADDDIYRAGKLCLLTPMVMEALESKMQDHPDVAQTLATLNAEEKARNFILNAATAHDIQKAAAKKQKMVKKLAA